MPPIANTRSVAELVIAEMIALSRYLGDVNTSAHKGEWIKSVKGAHEVRGKVRHRRLWSHRSGS